MAAVGANSNYVLNIVELNNVVTNITGLSGNAALSNAVSQLQEMVIYNEKRIATNTISKFNTTPIQIIDNLNLSNATLTVNGTTVAGTSYTSISTIGNGPSYMNFASTIAIGANAITFAAGGSNVGYITTGGTFAVSGPMILSGTGTPGLGKYLTCMDALGTAQWQVPAMPSDMRWKTDISTIQNHGLILERIRGVRFRWTDSGKEDVGVIAQDLMPVLAEAVIEGREGVPHQVSYHKIIPVLVEALKDLKARVAELEKALGSSQPS
jgi:hypothetical protein